MLVYLISQAPGAYMTPSRLESLVWIPKSRTTPIQTDHESKCQTSFLNIWLTGTYQLFYGHHVNHNKCSDLRGQPDFKLSTSPHQPYLECHKSALKRKHLFKCQKRTLWRDLPFSESKSEWKTPMSKLS